MVQYRMPHIYLPEIFKILFFKRPESVIIDFFKSYTGKKYAIVTGSCRAALYLTYLALNKKSNKVITSPLTCTSAITPIIEAGNLPVFVDIDSRTFLMDTKSLESIVDDNTIAIQAIHLGGVMCEMDKLISITKRKKIYLIEDCAQGFGAKYEGKNCGSFGDVACFSLAKNLFGIAGGILLTDDIQIYKKAKKLQYGFKKSKLLLSLYRWFRGLIETYRKNKLANFAFNILNSTRQNSKKTSLQNEIKELRRMLVKPNILEKKISAFQIKRRVKECLDKRIFVGNKLNRQLSNEQYKGYKNQKTSPQNGSPSYVKYYCYKSNFDSEVNIEKTSIDNGIELKHLEDKQNSFFQENFLSNELFSSYFNQKIDYSSYNKIHKDIFTIPTHEKLTSDDVTTLIEALRV